MQRRHESRAHVENSQPGSSAALDAHAPVAPLLLVPDVAAVAGEPRTRSHRRETRDTSVVLLDDNRIQRTGLSALLMAQAGLQLISVPGDPELQPRSIRQRGPEVVLLALRSVDAEPRRLVRSVRESYPEARLIVLGIVPGRCGVLDLVREGVSGIILESAALPELIATIRAVAAGACVFPPVLADVLFAEIRDEALGPRVIPVPEARMTAREREIADLISHGLRNKEIGMRLHIATNTVKTHVHNILEKFSARSRVEVAARGTGEQR
jgi:DNA-binding NarL/FixJ family response regulator